MLPPPAKKKLAAVVGPKGYLDKPEDLLLYEYDGSIDKARPEMVIFPRTTEDVVAIVKISKEPDAPGYDLTGLLTGSEGTMALVTRIIVRLMRKPELVKTLLAIYDSAEDCGLTVAEITARAITPVAIEMLDGVMLRMVEEATHAGYPLDAAAVLLIELEGMREMVEPQVEQVRQACMVSGAREFRVARSAEERDLL